MPAETCCPVAEPSVGREAASVIGIRKPDRDVGSRTPRAPRPTPHDTRPFIDRAWPHAAAVVTLAFLVLGLYWPVVGFDFVNWDDPWYVVNNPRITSWHPSNLWAIATEVAIKNYAPLTTYSYLVDHTLWGDWPGGYHLTNWLLHGVNVVLAYFLVARLTRSRVVGWLTAALFAVHPVHVETVAWIASRKGLVSAAFLLASLLFWLRPNRSLRDDGYGLLFLTLGLLSKAIAVVVPPVVLLYDVLVAREPFTKALSRQLVPGFFAICLLSVTMTAQSVEMGGVREHLALGKPHILAVDAIIVWRYIGMLARPHDLCVLYDPPTSGIAGDAAVAILCWLAVFCLAAAVRRKWPLVTLAIAGFFLFLLPVLNLFPLTTLMNDRYLYLPSIPLFALAAAAIARLGGWQGETRAARTWNPARVLRTAVFGTAAAVMLAGAAAATWGYMPVWRNGLTLWQHAMQHVPQLPVVQIQLANTLRDTGRNREALSVLRDALHNPRLDKHDGQRIREKLRAWR